MGVWLKFGDLLSLDDLRSWGFEIHVRVGWRGRGRGSDRCSFGFIFGRSRLLLNLSFSTQEPPSRDIVPVNFIRGKARSPKVKDNKKTRVATTCDNGSQQQPYNAVILCPVLAPVRVFPARVWARGFFTDTVPRNLYKRPKGATTFAPPWNT